MKIHPPHAPGKKSKNVTGINFADLFFSVSFYAQSLFWFYLLFILQYPPNFWRPADKKRRGRGELVKPTTPLIIGVFCYSLP